MQTFLRDIRGNSTWHVIIVVMLLAVMAGIGAMWWQGEQRYTQLMAQLAAREQEEAVESEVALLADFRTIVSISPTEDIALEYRCRGDVRLGVMEDADTGYCIGIHKLVMVTPNGEKTLETGYAETKADAPLLSGAQYKSFARGPARVVIEFAPGGCRLDEDVCGVGVPENFVTATYNTDSGQYIRINNFPAHGTALWDARGFSVLWVTPTCGGAGCDIAPIKMLSVESDVVKAVTGEQAASEAGARDVMGADLPYWKDLRWSGPGEFTVTLVETNGREREISGPAY